MRAAALRGPRESLVAILLCLGGSFAAHLLGWIALGMLPPLSEMMARFGPQEIELVAIVEAPPLPAPEPAVVAEPEPQPEPEPEPEPERVRREVAPEPVTAPPVPEPVPDEPPAAEEAIADFSGETLTNDTGDAWQTALGNGESFDGPIGRPNAQVTGRRRAGSAGGVEGAAGAPVAPAGPRVVAYADLSRRPSPQGDTDAILQRNYPPRARQLGVEGHVVLGFRIMPDGTVGRFRVRSESPTDQGFARACQRTVEQIRWEPPLANDGSAVATDASFECEFAVGL
jgi:TonB family protein